MTSSAVRRQAFSLLELLTVVGILALLASVLVPSLSSARNSAKQVTCSSQLRSLAQAAIDYGLEYNDAIPGVAALVLAAGAVALPGRGRWRCAALLAVGTLAVLGIPDPCG